MSPSIAGPSAKAGHFPSPGLTWGPSAIHRAFSPYSHLAGHNNGTKILFTVGGWEDRGTWPGVLANSTYSSSLVTNIVNVVNQYHFDGVDLDDEEDSNRTSNANYLAFVQKLRAALNAISPRPLLTQAFGSGYPGNQTAVMQLLDMSNSMTYYTCAAALPGSSHCANASPGGIPDVLSSHMTQYVNRPNFAIGFGWDQGERDREMDFDPIACAAKAKWAVDNGYSGFCAWGVGQSPNCESQWLSYVPAH